MVRTEKGAIILLGLSHANVDRLMAGQPIMFSGSTIGMEKEIDSVYIFAGTNEAEMRAELDKRGMIGETTKVIDEPQGSEYLRRRP